MYKGLTPYHVYIDSRDRFTGDNENFSVRLKNKILNVGAVQVMGISIPITYYEITSANNTLVLNNTSASVPVGNYTPTQLAAALEAAFVAITVGWTFSYDANNYKMRIYYGGVDLKVFATSTMLNVLGITTTGVDVSEQFSDSVCNLHSQQYFHIHSNKLTSAGYVLSQTTDSNDNQNVMCQVPINENFGSILNYRPVDEILNFESKSDFSELDFKLSFHDENLSVDLNSQPWSLHIIFWHQASPIRVYR
jgi:hypothetical protein